MSVQAGEKPAGWDSDEWATPPEVVAQYAAEFGPFTLDPCCRAETAQAPQYFTKDEDGLRRPWSGKVWLNPPYSAPGPWLEKAQRSVRSGACEVVVALLPASTDTRWFHDYVIGSADVRFLRGRVRFHGWEGTPIPSPKRPSLVAIYRKKC